MRSNDDGGDGPNTTTTCWDRCGLILPLYVEFRKDPLGLAMQEKPSPEALVSREHLTSVLCSGPTTNSKAGKGFRYPVASPGGGPTPTSESPAPAIRRWEGVDSTLPPPHCCLPKESESRETVSWQHGFGCSPCMGVCDSGPPPSPRGPQALWHQG